MIKVKYVGYLASIAGVREEEINAENARIKELLRLKGNVNWDEVIILVNGRPASLDTKVKSGDEVTVLPFTSGG